ncbi:MAG: chemotaxis protein CheW [Gammaproteobacteria bacterium]
MSKAAAWIMNINEQLYASVSQMELVHIINEPCYTAIPGAPAYCHKVIVWNDNILPVIDLSGLLNSAAVQSKREVVAVIIYRNGNDEIHYGGIILAKSPDLEFVENTQLCSLPTHTQKLKEIALSCFKSRAGHEVPILDMTRVFSSVAAPG